MISVKKMEAVVRGRLYDDERQDIFMAQRECRENGRGEVFMYAKYA